MTITENTKDKCHSCGLLRNTAFYKGVQLCRKCTIEALVDAEEPIIGSGTKATPTPESPSSVEEIVEEYKTRFGHLLAFLGETDDKKVAGINKTIWLDNILREVLQQQRQEVLQGGAMSTETKIEIYEDGQQAGEKIATERAIQIIKNAVSLVELLEADKKLSEADYELYGYGELCAEIKVVGGKFLTPKDITDNLK